MLSACIRSDLTEFLSNSSRFEMHVRPLGILPSLMTFATRGPLWPSQSTHFHPATMPQQAVELGHPIRSLS